MSGLVSHRDVKTARGQYRRRKEREKKREEHGGVDCDELSPGGGGGVGKSPFLEENEQSHSLLMRGVRVFLCCVLEVGPFALTMKHLEQISGFYIKDKWVQTGQLVVSFLL